MNFVKLFLFVCLGDFLNQVWAMLDYEDEEGRLLAGIPKQPVQQSNTMDNQWRLLNAPRYEDPQVYAKAMRGHPRSPLRSSAAKTKILFDVSECGRIKGCLFKPEGCMPHVNCSYAFSYRSDPSRVYMEILGEVVAESNAFVAVGFSTDALMGNDTVTDCSSFEGTAFQGRLSFNPGKTNRRVPIEENAQEEILSTHTAQYADGTLYCRLSQNIMPTLKLPAYYIRPLNFSYRIFLSAGRTDGRLDFSPNAGEDSPSPSSRLFSAPTVHEHQHVIGEPTDEHFHDDGDGVEDGLQGAVIKRKPALRDDPNIGPNTTAPTLPMSNDAEMKTRLLKAHDSVPIFKLSSTHIQRLSLHALEKDGLLFVHGGNDRQHNSQRSRPITMILAWTVLACSAILSARFLKDHWGGTKLCGVHIWFVIHRTINILTVLAFTGAFICILFRQQWTWIGPRVGDGVKQNTSPLAIHASLGILACCFGWLQPLNALLRCKPNGTYRIIYNFVHGLFGFSAWILAAGAIMVAVLYFKPIFLDPELAKALYIAYLAIVAFAFFNLEVLRIRKNWLKSVFNPTHPNPSNGIAPDKFDHTTVLGAPHQNNFVDAAVAKAENATDVAVANKFKGINALQSVILLMCLTFAFACTIYICVLIALQVE
ncbi:DOMON domain-containing protein [Ditylenchus destructor]|nr:DOMON domain-containing protein [Ditylenchus destructor]